MNKGHLLYVTFNLFRVEDLRILSIGRKMYFLSGVNYKQCCTMKVLNNQSLNSGQAFSEQGDQLVIDKGLGPLTFCSPIPYFRGSRVSIPVIQLLLLEIERTTHPFHHPQQDDEVRDVCLVFHTIYTQDFLRVYLATTGMGEDSASFLCLGHFV